MDNFNRLENKVDKIQDSIASIDKTLAVNTESLLVHIRRTNLLEKRLERFESDMKPVEQHVERVNGIIKFLLFIAAISGLAAIFKK